MGEEDVEILAFAEKNFDSQIWDESVRFEGRCLIGCEGRKMSRTKNLLVALRWTDYHREGAEHVSNLLKRREGSGVLMLPTNPPKEG
jgi:hypothetical protein